jgi:Protein of unknown function (DUF3632)
MDYETASRYYGALITGYLRAAPASALDEAIARFVAPVRSAFLHDQASESAIDAMLWAAWEPVLLAAGTASATTQDRLVDLLTGIKNQGVLTREQGRRECVIWGGLKVFTDLPCFGAQMREAWDMRADPPGSPEVWANMNAFAARLTAAGFDFSLYAIWTLRDCLEEGYQPGPAELRAAVPWFRDSGAALSRLAHQPGIPGEGDQCPARLGKLCRESGMTRGGFTAERWEFWRGRLADLATGTGAAAAEARSALHYLTAPDS